MDISIVNYSEKCIVVRGEDTEFIKEDLKSMGGKWNARLTNKETGERFGGWIFPVKFQSNIEKFLSTRSRSTNKSDNKEIKELRKRIEKLEKIVKQLMDDSESKEDFSESEEEIPHQRLLK